MENNELRNDFISLERNNSEFISLNRENKEVKENENVKFFNNTEDIVKSDVKKNSNFKIIFFVILGILGITAYTMLLLNVLNGLYTNKTTNILNALVNVEIKL
jgi:hypothetical protein